MKILHFCHLFFILNLILIYNNFIFITVIYAFCIWVEIWPRNMFLHIQYIASVQDLTDDLLLKSILTYSNTDTAVKPSNTQLNSVKNKALWYLRWDDVEQVSRRRVLLAEHIAVLRLKQDVQNFDDKRAAAQSRRQAVLTQKTTQLRLVLTHVLQSQFSTCKYTKQWWMKYGPSRPL